jgi:membrane protein required for colicin V production
MRSCPSVNWLDYLLVAVVGFSGSLALIRGFVREAAGLLGWAAGFVVASHYAGRAGRLLAHWTGKGDVTAEAPLGGTGSIVSGVGAFLLLFLMSLLAMNLVGQLAHSLVAKAGLSPANRLLGLTLGLTRGVLVVLVGLLILMLLNVPEPMWVNGSQLAPMCQTGIAYLVRWLPQDFPLLGRLQEQMADWEQDRPDAMSLEWIPPAPW